MPLGLLVNEGIEKLDVCNGVAIHQQKVGKRPFLNHAQLARVGAPQAVNSSSSALSAGAILSAAHRVSYLFVVSPKIW